MHVFEQTTLIKAPREDVFEFFRDPNNLLRITPSYVGLRIRSFDPPMRKESMIEHTMRWLVMPIRFDVMITDFAPPRHFTDQQVRGPYKFWRHTHAFEEVDGGTLMRDRVQYELPFGPIGSITHALVVGRQLRSIFDYRNREVRRIFATEQRSPAA